MDKNFIDKVHHIVISNITDENFGVTKLSSLIGLSTSQTLKKVKTITGKSVNQYIRELRLTKAAQLIKETDFTIAEIAYKVGFGSQSYFNKAFRRYYGITPGEYKTQSIEAIDSEKDPEPKQKRSKSQKTILFSILIILILIIAYIIIDKSPYQKINDQPPSIAVLPFKNISKDIDNQYFADGMWDDLLSHLSAIKGLDVRSRQSLERYRGSKKSMPTIGKELGANYILESSIQNVDDKLRIITQLIEAKSDKHIWSHEYDYKLKDIFKIQCEMSKLISKELNVILTDQEVKVLEKHPTENMEAYHLFLKGRLVNNNRKLENFELNIKLNKQAIVLDPNFAEAYAELANSYFLMGSYGFISRNEAHNKGNFYTDKALKINSDCFRANAVKAMTLWSQEEKWQKAIEYYDKAIALNPNDAAVHLQYGRYFLFFPIPDYNKYLYYITIAQRLNPFSSNVGGDYFRALILNDKIEEAEQYQNKMGFLWSKEVNLSRKSLLIAYKNKDWTTVIRFLEREIEKDPNNAFLYNQLGHAYDEIYNDDTNFIKYSKKAYELDSINSSNTVTYFNAMVEGKKFDAANILMQSTNFKSILKKKQQLSSLWYYYYHQENYKKAQDVLKDSLLVDELLSKLITYAQLEDRKSVDSLLRFRYSRIHSYKILVYAILKEKDSMYYYLELAGHRCGSNFRIMPRGAGINGPNNRREFDPYRKEERFKAFLRKNNLPITHWNE